MEQVWEYLGGPEKISAEAIKRFEPVDEGPVT
jgi:hypothetical protein